MATEPQNRAAYLTAADAPAFEIMDAPMPSPAADQVTIRVRAIAFNPLDAVMRKGFMLSSFPAIIGCDVAGEVVAVGSRASELGLSIGDRVAGCCDLIEDRAGKGVFQLFCNIQVRCTARVPDAIELKDAAVLPICLVTAAVGLCHPRCLGMPLPRLEPEDAGKTVLIWGGASSVGSCGIMLAKAAGLKVAATAGHYNFDYLKSIGVDYAFDYRSSTVAKDIAAALKGQGEFMGSFAAVMDKEAYFACAEVCVALGGKQTVSTVLPEFMKFEEKLPGDVQIAYSTSPNPMSHIASTADRRRRRCLDGDPRYRVWCLQGLVHSRPREWRS